MGKPSKKGRPAYDNRRVLSMILRWHQQGRGLGDVAGLLNLNGIPTAAGKKWTRQGVKNVLGRALMDRAVTGLAESLYGELTRWVNEMRQRRKPPPP